GVILPGVGAGTDGEEAVDAVLVGQAAANTEKVRVERPRPLVIAVDVAPGRIGLPDLEERVRHGVAMVVEHTPGHDDTLADRLAAGAGVARQVGVRGRDRADGGPRPGQLRERER